MAWLKWLWNKSDQPPKSVVNGKPDADIDAPERQTTPIPMKGVCPACGMWVYFQSDESLPRHCGRTQVTNVQHVPGANVEPVAPTLLQAAAKGDIHFVRLHLSCGAPVDAVDESGKTGLHLAAQHGRKDVIDVLVAAGANVDARDQRDRTPLHLAADASEEEALSALLAHRASANARDTYGETALHSVAAAGKTGLVRKMVSAGADVDASSGTGKTPLNAAVCGGKSETVKALLQAGAAVSAQDLDAAEGVIKEIEKHAQERSSLREAGDRLLGKDIEARNQAAATLEIIQMLRQAPLRQPVAPPAESDSERAAAVHFDPEGEYRNLARTLTTRFGRLTRVEYLSHYPNFEINFVFERGTVYSGRRRGERDIHFLSLGYVGEGPRYAREFLDELGFRMSSEEIAQIEPGAVIRKTEHGVTVDYFQ